MSTCLIECYLCLKKRKLKYTYFSQVFLLEIQSQFESRYCTILGICYGLHTMADAVGPQFVERDEDVLRGAGHVQQGPAGHHLRQRPHQERRDPGRVHRRIERGHGVGQDAAGDVLALHEHAVAVEDDEVCRGHRTLLQRASMKWNVLQRARGGEDRRVAYATLPLLVDRI